MCDQWWDERLAKEQAEKLKRSSLPPAPERTEQQKPERKPQNQPDPVPV